MLKVNILTGTPDKTRFLRQLDNELFSNFQFYENSNENIVWDVVVVYEELEKEVFLKHKKGGLIFISGEPPLSRVYSEKFLNQFNHLITAHPKIKHNNNHLTQQALDWHYGFDFFKGIYNKNFEELNNAIPPVKTKNISIISSNKKMMPGHKKRFLFLEKLKKDFSEEIDFYGKGTNPVNDKAEAIDPYRFHICIENTSIKNYWSEKFADPILGFSVPIYHGCKNINSYFSKDSFIEVNINNYTDCKKVIEKILKNPEEIYNQYLNNVVVSRRKLLYEYNIFKVISDFYYNHIEKNEINLQTTILTKNNFKDYNFLMYKLRLKRLILRYIIQ